MKHTFATLCREVQSAMTKGQSQNKQNCYITYDAHSLL